MVAVRPVTLPALIERLAACADHASADAALAPHVAALGGLPDADALVRIEIARWMLEHHPMHPATNRVLWLISAEHAKHDTGYYIDDPRRVLVLRTAMPATGEAGGGW